jgi:hypothetical protein
MTTAAPESTTVLGVSELTVPDEWECVLNAWPQAPAPSGVVEGIERAHAAGLLANAAAAGTFLGDLRKALASASGSVVVTYPDPAWVVPVVSLVSALLGGVAYQEDSTLGGPASAVPTGGIDRYEQAWHTDSTPWDSPNRWSVLGLLREDPALEQRATAVLPWTLVAAEWAADDGLREALRTHLFSWRRQYSGLPVLHAPVLGDVPRWFRPALAALIDDPQQRVAACAAVDQVLKRTTTWYEAEVSPRRVLIFDNHAVLHRGPAVRKPSTRTLLRLKVDGVPRR